MFEKKLNGKRIAILTTDGFEQSELLKPKEALENEGAQVHVISPDGNTVKGWNKNEWGKKISVDRNLNEVSSEEYDALMLPGGVINPDKLRMNAEAIEFVKGFVTSHKPIAAICHGPQTLIETGILDGKALTSWPSLKTDIENAGGKWIDAEVVCDKGLVTSRKPEDIPAFNLKMIEEFKKAHTMPPASKRNTSLRTKALLS